MICNKCKEIYPYAIANMPDGTLMCYECREQPLANLFRKQNIIKTSPLPTVKQIIKPKVKIIKK